MKLLLPLFSILLIGTPAVAQGVSAPWDISQTAKDLATQAERLRPILDQLTPEQWQTKGAPAAYVVQWQTAKSELANVIGAATRLSKQPDKLTTALETYFRMQSLETQLNSLVDGVRRYQNPSVGDLVISVMAANSTNQDQLRQYITDLAETRDQELRVIDQEAQRCRSSLMRQPAARQTNKPAGSPAGSTSDSTGNATSNTPSNTPSTPTTTPASK